MKLSSLMRGMPLALLLLAGQAPPALAATEAAKAQQERQQAQPLNNAPVWREVRSEQAGFSTLPAPEAGVLIQSAGLTWREWRNGPLTLYGGLLLVLVPTLIGLFYLRKGPLKVREPPTGRKAQRFTRFERIAHWGTALSFLVLALSGVMMLFGKHVLTPVLGHWLAALLIVLGKNLHNLIGPVFLGFLLVMIFHFAKDNLWEACDALWIRKGGGLFNGEHVPAGRFNFGEKAWFWLGVTVVGLVVSSSGLALDFPNFGQTRALMQTLNLIHGVAALALIALAFSHIYMGTLGTEGALDAMRSGEVDEAWAKEHHELWYDRVKSGKPGAS